MNLVAGATGALGGEICRALLRRGRPVRALVRRTSDRRRVALLRELGAEVVVRDLSDHASLAAACAGAETVVSGVTALRSSAPDNTIERVDRDGQKRLVDAAVAAAARRFFYISCAPSLDTQSPLMRAKREVEEYLKASGLAYGILRPTFFMETWLSRAGGFDLPSRRVLVYGPGTARVSWVALADVADLAAAAVDEPDARDTVVDVGGPDPLSPLEVVRLAERIGGMAIETEHVAIETLLRQKAEAASAAQESLAALMIDLARGDSLAGGIAASTHVRDYLGAL